MKYQADDGEVFESEQDCTAHEARLAVEAKLRLEVDKYVDGMDGQTDGAGSAMSRFRRTWLLTTIMAWIRYDLEMHPDRYDESANS